MIIAAEPNNFAMSTVLVHCVRILCDGCKHKIMVGIISTTKLNKLNSYCSDTFYLAFLTILSLNHDYFSKQHWQIELIILILIQWQINICIRTRYVHQTWLLVCFIAFVITFSWLNWRLDDFELFNDEWLMEKDQEENFFSHMYGVMLVFT